MKLSAALAIPRHHLPACLAAVDHSYVSTPNNKGEVCVDPSLAQNTAMLSTRHRALVGPGRPGPGFLHRPSSLAPPVGLVVMPAVRQP